MNNKKCDLSRQDGLTVCEKLNSWRFERNSALRYMYGFNFMFSPCIF